MSPLADASRSVVAHLFTRQTFVDDAKNTLGSWDSCMSKAYCKWPVIAVIIIGSLIVLSVLICIGRFCCCGIECCFGCCACCNACCPSPRGRRGGNYQQAPQQFTPQPYGYTPPMNYGYAPPQFATFETPSRGPVKEDSLPAMPSWEQSQSRKIEDTSYHGAGAGNAATTDFGANGQSGIALGAVSPQGKRIRDDVPVREQLYEDPEDQTQPILDGPEEARHQQYDMPYQQQQQQQPTTSFGQYQNAPSYGHQNYATSEYTDGGDRYSSPSQASGAYQPPQHPYMAHQQQQSYAEVSDQSAMSPTSMYSNQYPPTYASRAPSLARHQQPMDYSQQQPQPRFQQSVDYNHPLLQQQQQQQPYTRSPPPAAGRPFSPPQSTVYQPPTTVPSILSPGNGAPHAYNEPPSRYHEMD